MAPIVERAHRVGRRHRGAGRVDGIPHDSRNSVATVNDRPPVEVRPSLVPTGEWRKALTESNPSQTRHTPSNQEVGGSGSLKHQVGRGKGSVLGTGIQPEQWPATVMAVGRLRALLV
jgi:hypothetical protein